MKACRLFILVDEISPEGSPGAVSSSATSCGALSHLKVPRIASKRSALTPSGRTAALVEVDINNVDVTVAAV